MKKSSLIVVLAAILAGNPAARAAEPSRHDQLRIAVQKICPVSGKKLGENGTPIKGKVREETVFFCCEDCLKQEVNAEHWSAIHANIAKAQTICPVMKKPLPEDPKSTIVEGQVFYLCCPPCGKKIAADSARYLRQVDGLYAASLEAEKRDRR